MPGKRFLACSASIGRDLPSGLRGAYEHSEIHHPNVRYYATGDGYSNGALYEYDGTIGSEVSGDMLKFSTVYAYHG